jgi:ketosteroid isomerase-like protein
VEIVRRAMEAASRRDVEALEALVSENLRFESTFAASEGREFGGPSAIRDYFAALDEAFDELRIELEDVVEAAGPRVAIRARVSGLGRGSGIAIDHVYGQVWTIADGRVEHIVSYLDPEQARVS